ncbi:MAG: glycosyltransferase [Bacteroidetes bacterium]|nr:glycosyltransferase [Bacteroidota bacterium]
MPKIAVIIPCYNEAKRLSPEIFKNFLILKSDIELIFVNDGSKDKTSEILDALQNESYNKVSVINLPKNQGKAVAIREGIRNAVAKNIFTHIGYLDADLSTGLDEFYNLYYLANKQQVDYVFSSRVKMLGSKIERSLFRHFVGRFIATLIDVRYRLGIYDTQCGAKCFSSNLIEHVCNEPFKTKWFFDVEIFLRIRNNQSTFEGIEQPLKKWKNYGGSKLNIWKFPMILKEIFLLFKNYSKN